MEEKQRLQSGTEKVTVSKSCSNVQRRRMEGPDRGWAWVVAFASCMINFIMAGLGRMSGILFVAFIEMFGVDRKSASMPFSVRSSARNLFGPVVGILGQKYGARKVVVIGGVVGTISSAACFFTPDILWITVLWGGVSGVGAALIVTLPQVVIGQYFDKHRTTANGISFSGGCVGSFLFPVLLEYLLHNYGIEGTFLIIGAIIMHTIPAALILRKPSWLTRSGAHRNDEPLHRAESLDNLVGEGNNVVGAKEGQIASECKPSKFTAKVTEPACLENGMYFTGINEISFRSTDECTPKGLTPKSARRNSDSYPDVKFLRKNNELVIKILNFCNTSNSGRPVEINHNDFCVINEIESVCNSFQKTQPSQFKKNLKRIKTKLFVEDEKDYLKVNSDENFHLGKELSEIQTPQLRSLPDLTKMANEEVSVHILKLSELEELDEDDLIANFPDEKIRIILVLTELRKLNKLYPRASTEFSEMCEKKETALPNSSKLEKDKDSYSNSFSDHIKTAFWLHVNPMFLMVCLCRAVHFITFVPAMTTVVDFCMDKGLPEDDGKFAIAAISMGDLIGRLCFGWITDRGFMTLPKFMMVVMVLQGISTASLPVMWSKATIFSNLVLFGMLQGSLFVRHPVLISNYMRAHEQSIAMGCVNFFSGLLGFGLPIYIGYFRDTMGSYDYIFCINGAIGALVGVLWAFEPFFVRYVNAKRTTQKIAV